MNREVFRVFLGDVDLFYGEILAGEDGFFKASAVRAVALVLDDIENFVALVALGHAGYDIHDELRALKYRSLGRNGINLLDILRDDERQLADIQNDLVYLLDIVFGGEAFDRAHDLLYNTYLMHITS